MADLGKLTASLIAGHAPEVQKLTQQAIDEKILPAEILENGLISGMNIVGQKFKNNEFYVPEVLIAARAMKAGMTLLRPLLAETGVASKGTIVVGTVKGDLHDIGKNLVAMMLEGAGFDIIDLGTDVTAEKYLQIARENRAQIVGLSALLTTTMVGMRQIVELIRKEEGDKIKIIIGGAPVTQDYADEIGANGYAPDAASSVDLVKSIIAA